MAAKNRRGGDWVLGGGHLVGIFILLVVLFGMVFTLGYLLGRNQYDAQLHAAASSIPGKPDILAERSNEKPLRTGRGATDTPAAKPDNSAPPLDWTFYHSGEPEKTPELTPQTPKNLLPGRPSSPEIGKPASRIDSPRSNLKSLSPPPIPQGAVVLQIAAMARQGDAVSLARALQQKRFPAFVLPPGGDRFYRVQVGPYVDAQSADLARQKLESQGFKAITRR